MQSTKDCIKNHEKGVSEFEARGYSKIVKTRQVQRGWNQREKEKADEGGHAARLVLFYWQREISDSPTPGDSTDRAPLVDTVPREILLYPCRTLSPH